MEKVRTNTGKVYDVTYHIKGDNTQNTVNADGEHVQTIYSHYVYAVNEKHAQQIVESYDADAEIVSIEEQFDAISQHYGE